MSLYPQHQCDLPDNYPQSSPCPHPYKDDELSKMISEEEEERDHRSDLYESNSSSAATQEDDRKPLSSIEAFQSNVEDLPRRCSEVTAHEQETLKQQCRPPRNTTQQLNPRRQSRSNNNNNVDDDDPLYRYNFFSYPCHPQQWHNQKRKFLMFVRILLRCLYARDRLCYHRLRRSICHIWRRARQEQRRRSAEQRRHSSTTASSSWIIPPDEDDMDGSNESRVVQVLLQMHQCLQQTLTEEQWNMGVLYWKYYVHRVKRHRQFQRQQQEQYLQVLHHGREDGHRPLAVDEVRNPPVLILDTDLK